MYKKQIFKPAVAKMYLPREKHYITGTPSLHGGWRGRWDALKWFISGKAPTPFVAIPIDVGGVKIECMGGGGGGSSLDAGTGGAGEALWSLKTHNTQNN